MPTTVEKRTTTKQQAENVGNQTTSVAGHGVWLPLETRRQIGRSERTTLPRGQHGDFVPDPGRPDPVRVLEEQSKDRIQELLPVRWGRMLASPFAFYRGAAAIMAWDLSRLPRTGLSAQLSGDAHIANFGFFGSPERQLLFDINDFDETHPGPWEWDVKRLATSGVLAAREQGFSAAAARDIALEAVRAYRERIEQLSQMTTLEIWYSHVTALSIIEGIADSKRRKIARRRMDKARSKTSVRAIEKYTEVLGGNLRIRETPPLVERLPEEEVATLVQPIFQKYAQSLQEDRQHLIDQYVYVDAARRVGGVGSVGTRCNIVVLTGRDVSDPLVLQLKEASPSVLAPFVPPSKYRNEAQRVVEGQRLTQGASDLFLGWLRFSASRDFYFRQLYDMKASVAIDEMDEALLGQYAGKCGELLARAHAKSGDAVSISAYLGNGDRFDEAIADFAFRYADQSERDFESLEKAVRAGRLEAQTGI